MTDDPRTKLNPRHRAMRDKVKFQDSRGSDHWIEVGYGLDEALQVKEVFAIAAKEGTDLQALVHDACIALSHCLQRGATITDMAKSFLENRQEGAAEGPPASFIGAVARHAVQIEAAAPAYYAAEAQQP